MSEVKTIHGLDEIRNDFDLLILNLEQAIKEFRPRTNILNTRLGKIKEDLSRVDLLEKESIAKVMELAVKFNGVNKLFNGNVLYSKKDLFRIIEGNNNYQQDSGEQYNNYFFEISMGLRFVSVRHQSNIRINLDSDCDVIVNDIIAIECKYIHSLSNFMKNMKKAKNQIGCRVQEGVAKFGFIAVDFSHVFPWGKVEEFANYTLERFIKNYKHLRSCGVFDGNLLEKILLDRNFSNIINGYMMGELETILYGEIDFSYDMGPKVFAVIAQVSNSFFFEFEGQIRPLAVRGVTYILNGGLMMRLLLK